MTTVNIHEGKTQLSLLTQDARLARYGAQVRKVRASATGGPLAVHLGEQAPESGSREFVELADAAAETLFADRAPLVAGDLGLRAPAAHGEPRSPLRVELGSERADPTVDRRSLRTSSLTITTGRVAAVSDPRPGSVQRIS